jgi:outer membrane protein TolC
MRKATQIIVWLILAVWRLGAQEVLTIDRLFQQVRQNHPAARQAALLQATAQADWMKAKGGFDVKLSAEQDGKIFKDKTYYSLGDYSLKLPSQAGLEFKAGYAVARGSLLNPSETLPAAGQAYLGFEWAVGRGLLTDRRRTDVAQARAGLKLGALEAGLLLNDVCFDAAKLYWSWVIKKQQESVYGVAYQRSLDRLEGIREAYRQGDKPAVDTLEALLLVQSRLLDWQEAIRDSRNEAIALGGMLWKTPDQATFPADSIVAPVLSGTEPLPVSAADVEMRAATLRDRHPALIATSVKLEQLRLEERLMREFRKPELTFKYYLLGSGLSFFPGSSGPGDVFTNNIKYGVQVAYPLQNRKARADWQKAGIKIGQTTASLQEKRQALEVKLRFYANECNAVAGQIRLATAMRDNYRTLLEAEQEKFRQGESTLFLLNAREQKWLEAQIKLAKLQGEYEKARAGMMWAEGRLGGS